MPTSEPRAFAFYCSGHGFGHATRVVATTEALLRAGHSVWIVTNARRSIFDQVLNQGAQYRKAPIDAGISQPKAYSVDRAATLAGLQAFLEAREGRILEEVSWLKGNVIDAVLSDAPFLPCAAAAAADLPSAIISNFTFDSCYSYLDIPPSSLDDTLDDEDEPLTLDVLAPLVHQTIEDYKQASLLLRLPGCIPLPSFDLDVPLPASKWVDRRLKRFTTEIDALLSRPASQVPASIGSRKRTVVDVPLIVRAIDPKAKTAAGRATVLAKVGIPAEHHNRDDTRILLVSFGGQKIPKPASRAPTPEGSPLLQHAQLPSPASLSASPRLAVSSLRPPPLTRVATQNHLYLPGAPPAFTHSISPTNGSGSIRKNSLRPHAGLLPEGWIAVVCGLSENALKEELPKGFYAAANAYIPDLCAASDALLGKLGYGTCSETIAAQLPFIYVPRPLFVEEYGLKRLTEQRNTLVEMDRDSFESGNWADFVETAWQQHQERPPPAIEEEDAGTVIVRELEAWLGVPV